MSGLKDHYFGDELYPATPGFKEPTTSREAAVVISGKAALLRERVIAIIADAGDRGLTPDEAATLLGEDEKAIRPRFTELGPRHLNKIVETGERRQNESGLKAKAWRIA